MKYKGFIGLGVMGNPMAGHLSKMFSTMVYNRTQSKTDVWLETYKGQTCTNPAELGKNCNEVWANGNTGSYQCAGDYPNC